jgi:hypothetical protein
LFCRFHTAEAEEHLAALVIKYGSDPEKALSLGPPGETDWKPAVLRIEKNAMMQALHGEPPSPNVRGLFAGAERSIRR